MSDDSLMSMASSCEGTVMQHHSSVINELFLSDVFFFCKQFSMALYSSIDCQAKLFFTSRELQNIFLAILNIAVFIF